MNLQSTLSLYFGGPNSGDKGHVGRPGERGGSGTGKDQDRSTRAKNSLKPTFQYHVQRSARNEEKLAKALGAKQVGGQASFDVLHMKYKMGFEVKTLLNQENQKLTMHPSSLKRKLKEAKSLGLKKVVTVAFDDRDALQRRIFYKIGLGSFRLSSMNQVKSLAKLKEELLK